MTGRRTAGTMDRVRATATTLLLACAAGCTGGWQGPPPGRSTGSTAAGGAEAGPTTVRADEPANGFARVDQVHADELTDDDPVLEVDGSRYDSYPFDASQGASIVLVMRSEEVEPYLHLLGPDGAQLAHGGAPPGESGVAELVLVAPESGTYQVYANALEPSMRGRYELRVVVEPPPRGVRVSR